jgi:uncharacterized protein
MKKLLRQIDLLRLLALVLLILPGLALFVFGILWLWQAGNLLYWLAVMLICGGLGYGLQRWLVWRDRKLLAEAVTEPNPDWPPSANEAWQQVKVLADETDPIDWPLEDGSWILALGRRALETVSHCYHPNVEKPALELTVPHALLIIEHASRDLRKDISENIPFSDRLTIGDLIRIQRWKAKAERAFDVYRAGRMVINPLDAMTSEIWRHLRENSFGLARSELHRWLLQAYMRKVGYYAIDLYSGRQPLDQDEPLISRTPASDADMGEAEKKDLIPEEEPLRILVLGRANSGKSSLINALFGKLTTKTQVVPDTTQILTPFVLLREGLTQALIFDSPGCDSEHFDQIKIQQAALDADLILWASPANRPDRQSERQCLDDLRAFFSTHINRRPPPLLVAVTHIDQLSPARVWQPPYDLVSSQEPKAITIRAAVKAVASDLVVPTDQVIPVCLREGSVYNVDDALWSAIMNHQDEALRIRLYRCLDAKKQAENWERLRHQLMNTGRFLWQLPSTLRKRVDN